MRGEAGVDLEALRATIQRVSQLVGEFPQIVELDINPFVAFEPGRVSMALDGRIVITSEDVRSGTDRGGEVRQPATARAAAG